MRARAYEQARRVVFERDAGQCFACGRAGGQVHHRVKRSQGRDDRPANLILLCGACHDKVERDPDRRATRAGLVLRAGSSPDHTPAVRFVWSLDRDAEVVWLVGTGCQPVPCLMLDHYSPAEVGDMIAAWDRAALEGGFRQGATL